MKRTVSLEENFSIILRYDLRKSSLTSALSFAYIQFLKQLQPSIFLTKFNIYTRFGKAKNCAVGSEENFGGSQENLDL